MTVSKKLRDYLDTNKVKYSVSSHKLAYTAQEVAAAQGVTGWQVAKSVVFMCDREFMVVVLQAPATVDIPRMRESLGCKEVRLASEAEIEKLFPGVEIGAESPFGNLYNIPVYVDKNLTEMPEIVFNAGTHTETIRMKYDDYARLVNPRLISVSKAAPV